MHIDSGTHGIQFLAIFVTALIGSFIGFLSTSLVSYITGRDAAFKASYANVIAKIHAAADLASEYWLMPVNSDPSLVRDVAASDMFTKAALLEVKILGLQNQIIYLDDQLRFNLPDKFRPTLIDARNKLIDSLTGGSYKSRDGAAEYTLSIQCQNNAAVLSARLHGALRYRVMARYLIGRFFKRLQFWTA